jgi:hypothetical protein
MIQGYPDRPALRPEEKLRLHVSTDNPHKSFRVDFYRQGAELVKMGSLDAQIGYHFAQLRHHDDWGWPGYNFPIPNNWPSGAYIANLVETDQQGEPIANSEEVSADGRNAKALFVVKSSSPGQNAQILYKLSLTTYHAYNYAGGGNLYVGEWFTHPITKTRVNKVSIHRPGGGTGNAIPQFDASNNLSNSFDPYDEGSPRQTFAHWDVPFIAWLEKNGYQVDYCTDFDLHEERDLLTPYRLLLSVGHDEYWSDEMRAHVEAFIQQGGNVAFFSGNTCWWHIEFCDFSKCADDKLHPTAFIRDFYTWKRNPENSLTGVSYRNGGGWWTGDRKAVGYTVQNADHWVYEGTGLRNGDVFGADDHLVGYECDGALFTRDNHGFPVPTGADGTPSDFVILGLGELADREWQFEARENQGPQAATMGLYTRGGIVFTAATTDWTRVLTTNTHVAKITQNVLNRLKAHAVRIVGPFSSGDGVPVVRADIKFQVDATGLPNQESLNYKWTISGGDPVAKLPLDQPVFEALMPSSPTPVTVTVEIDDGAGYEAFGTLTFTPLSEQDYLQFQLWNSLRELATLAQTAFKKDNKNSLVFPLWDASLGRALTPSLQDLQYVVLGAQQLTRLAEQLRELAERLIDGTKDSKG